MKKRLLIALAVVLSLSVAGCGKSEKKAGLANKDIIGIWQCAAALESMDSYSKSVVEGANDLLPAGSTMQFKIDKKNMRITREFEPRGVFVHERNH